MNKARKIARSLNIIKKCNFISCRLIGKSWFFGNHISVFESQQDKLKIVLYTY